MTRQLAAAHRLTELLQRFVKQCGYRAEDVVLVENFRHTGHPAVAVEISGFDYSVGRAGVEVTWDGHSFAPVPFASGNTTNIETFSEGVCVLYPAVAHV